MKTTHTHHIIPRHAGGTDAPENLIELTIEEHAEAHRLLYEEFGRWEDEIAWKTLSGQINKYEAQQLARSYAMKGFKHSDETKAKMKESAKLLIDKQKADGTWEEVNKKRSEALKGKERTAEHAANNTKSRKDNGKPWHSDETKKKIAESVRKAQLGKKRGPYKTKNKNI